MYRKFASDYEKCCADSRDNSSDNAYDSVYLLGFCIVLFLYEIIYPCRKNCSGSLKMLAKSKKAEIISSTMSFFVPPNSVALSSFFDCCFHFCSPFHTLCGMPYYTRRGIGCQWEIQICKKIPPKTAVNVYAVKF